MNDFEALVRRQRAHRAFAPDDVDEETIDAIVSAATFAPSAEKSQPWVFVVVRDRTMRERIGDVMAATWLQAREYSRARLAESLFAEVDAGLGSGSIAAAPVLIVVAVDRELVHPGAIGSSAFPAVQNLLLAATARGLGSALTTIATTHAEDLQSLLDLDPQHEPIAVIPIGHPARPLGPGRRQPPRVVRR